MFVLIIVFEETLADAFSSWNSVYALSTERCMLGNQDRYLARDVLFLLC